MNTTIKGALKAAGFSIHAGNGAVVALLGKRPNRTDVELDAIDGVMLLTIRRNSEETVQTVADEAAALAALIVAGILPAPAKAAPRFTADLNRRAWAIRRDAAARFGLKVTAISWAECLKLARA